MFPITEQELSELAGLWTEEQIVGFKSLWQKYEDAKKEDAVINALDFFAQFVESIQECKFERLCFFSAKKKQLDSPAQSTMPSKSGKVSEEKNAAGEKREGLKILIGLMGKLNEEFASLKTLMLSKPSSETSTAEAKDSITPDSSNYRNHVQLISYRLALLNNSIKILETALTVIQQRKFFTRDKPDVNWQRMIFSTACFVMVVTSVMKLKDTKSAMEGINILAQTVVASGAIYQIDSAKQRDSEADNLKKLLQGNLQAERILLIKQINRLVSCLDSQKRASLAQIDQPAKMTSLPA